MTHQALKTWRVAQGFNQAQAAEKLGKSLRAYQYWESGHQPIPETVGKLVELLQEPQNQ